MSFTVYDNLTMKSTNLIKSHECKLMRLWWFVDLSAVHRSCMPLSFEVDSEITPIRFYVSSWKINWHTFCCALFSILAGEYELMFL